MARTLDPQLTEAAAALLGTPAPDVLQLIAKSQPDTSAVHVPGGDAKRERRLAATGLAATGAAGVGGVHALWLTARDAPKKVRLGRAAALGSAGWLGLHGVELLSDSLGARAQVKALRANPAAPRKPRKPRTDSPATPAALAKRAEAVDLTFTGTIAKFDTDKRQVFGWCSLSSVDGAPVVDLQGDYVPIEEIETSAYRYVLTSRKGGDMHKRVSKLAPGDQPLHTADLVESFVVTPEKLQKMGLAPDALPLGWWVGFQVHDEDQWQLVKSGERAGFSIHGTGSRRPFEQAGGLAKFDSGDRARKLKLRTRDGGKELAARTRNALHPPAVKLRPVTSTAISALGYRKPTRQLAIEMHSRPGAPYHYKASAEQAETLRTAPSVGSHYARQIRGQYPRKEKLTPLDRGRLLLTPSTGV